VALSWTNRIEDQAVCVCVCVCEEQTWERRIRGESVCVCEEQIGFEERGVCAPQR